MGQLRSSGLVSIVAALTTTTLLTVPTGQKSVIKKIMWSNRTGANAYLRIGYTDNLAAFNQVLPDILMLGGPAIDGELAEPDLPKCGNTEDGFTLDTNAAAGSTGLIVAQSTAGGAAPADVQVTIEVDEL